MKFLLALLRLFTLAIAIAACHPLGLTPAGFSDAEAHARKVVFVQISEKQAEGGRSWWGSGILVRDENRYFVVTNEHVVRPAMLYPRTAYFVEVSAAEGLCRVREGEGLEITGSDAVTDLAVLEVKFPVGCSVDAFDLRVEDSTPLSSGLPVIAIGAPTSAIGPAKDTVSFGVVSNASRVINHTKYIQTDAAISAGNSGGALLDADGNLLGVNAAGIGPDLNVAVDWPVASKVVTEIIEHGRFIRGSLAISAQWVVTASSEDRTTPELRIGSVVLRGAAIDKKYLSNAEFEKGGRDLRGHRRDAYWRYLGRPLDVAAERGS